MEDKSIAQRSVIEDVEDLRGLDVEDKEVMAQVGKKQQLKV